MLKDALIIGVTILAFFTMLYYLEEMVRPKRKK